MLTSIGENLIDHDNLPHLLVFFPEAVVFPSRGI